MGTALAGILGGLVTLIYLAAPLILLGVALLLAAQIWWKVMRWVDEKKTKKTKKIK